MLCIVAEVVAFVWGLTYSCWRNSGFFSQQMRSIHLFNLWRVRSLLKFQSLFSCLRPYSLVNDASDSIKLWACILQQKVDGLFFLGEVGWHYSSNWRFSSRSRDVPSSHPLRQDCKKNDCFHFHVEWVISDMLPVLLFISGIRWHSTHQAHTSCNPNCSGVIDTN
jgi:hypothetical protein